MFEKIKNSVKKLNSTYSYYFKNKTIYVFFIWFMFTMPIFCIFFNHLKNLPSITSMIIIFVYGSLITYLPCLILQKIDNYTKHSKSFIVLFGRNLCQIEKDYLKSKKITWIFLCLILVISLNLLFQSNSLKINIINPLVLDVFPNIITIFLFLMTIGLSIFFTDFVFLILHIFVFSKKNNKN